MVHEAHERVVDFEPLEQDPSIDEVARVVLGVHATCREDELPFGVPDGQRVDRHVGEQRARQPSYVDPAMRRPSQLGKRQLPHLPTSPRRLCDADHTRHGNQREEE